MRNHDDELEDAIIYDPDEREPNEYEFELTREEKKWYILGAMKSGVIIWAVYMAGMIGLTLLIILGWKIFN